GCPGRRGAGAGPRPSHAPPGAVRQAPRAAMRLLHPGHPDDAHGGAPRQSPSGRDGGSRGARRSSVPVHRLSGNGRCGAGPRPPRYRGCALSPPRFVGAPVTRREDARLLTGPATFVDDLNIPGVAHAAFVRSPHAHAWITRVDVSRARATPGVLAVIAGHDLDLPPLLLRMGSPIPGTELRAAPRLALPRDKVRHVGEAVAVVGAESRSPPGGAPGPVGLGYDMPPP